MTKLKPCPFCGKKAETRQVRIIYDVPGYQVHHYCELFSQHLYTGIYGTEKEAADAWNRRDRNE